MTTGLFRDDTTIRDGLAAWWSYKFNTSGTTVTELIRPASGRSNETVLAAVEYHGGAERVAVRLPTLVPSFPNYDLEGQSRLHVALAAQGIPMARLVAYEDDVRWFGDAFMVMRVEPGHSVGDAPAFDRWLNRSSSAVQRRVEDQFISVLARLHRLNWRQLELGEGFRQSGADMATELDWWRDYLNWAAGDGAIHPRLQAIFDWCAAVPPEPHSSLSLCWGDARLGNILYDETGTISVVLDWELASIGPPEMDVAWFLVLDEVFGELSGKRVPGFRDRQAALNEYENRIGRKMRNLQWHKVFALFRAAAVTDRQARTAQALGDEYPGVSVDDNPLVSKAECLMSNDG
ncbi:phosphotransferase family protein [Mycobacterium sp. 1245805.9]|uniref:phosphotransferase family protein n=1 Tax=Mycobacterium sp. 1245805.9 TaxID=1856862 RepID=UPI0007FC036D|nr:phosphotransferase family protein [Mycobacterium sp. 1245805.9]OBI94155.1 hypothetical protein A9X00_12415 [Mycobacterium sp. 1245805.9]